MTGTTHSWMWHHTGMAVEDINESARFYRDCFGYEIIFEAHGMTDLISSITGVAGLGGHLIQCQSPMSGHVLELIQFTNTPTSQIVDAPIRPGQAHNAFLVSDLDHAIDDVKRNGGRVLGQITEFSEGRAVYCKEASGSFIELEETNQRKPR